MPELPEVETTVRGLQEILRGRTIKAVWTDYNSSFHAGKDNIKNPEFFKKFHREIVGKKVIDASRRAKNVLIHLDGGKTILIHMKMTGHLLYGNYRQKQKTWMPTETAAKENPALLDPYNKFIHFVITLDNGKELAFSDMRKFAKITLIPTNTLDKSADLAALGPEPLESSFTFDRFKERLLIRPNGRIKQVLMDQSVIAGIGNIYSDEVLWYAGVHPKSIVRRIPKQSQRKIYTEIKRILEWSIKLGGDSMSDFRNLRGDRGGFHPYHAAYMQHGKPCGKLACVKIFCSTSGKRGAIVKIRIGGRSAHFCPLHQKLF